jgi:DNA repair protein RecN (Recombination protein N)
MLRFLRIKHLAVIDSVELEFDRGLNVLTGETGAGKSILVGAVSLLLGSRASGDLVRTGEQVATIEAIFESASGVERLVRREITSQGRSRAFVDGELTTAGALKELAGQLVELHGQHEHQTLLDSATHLAVLDGFGGLDTLVAPTRSAFERLQAAAGARQQLQTAAADRALRHELAAFQLGELEKAMLKSAAPGQPAEDEELAATRQVLANAERVERLCAESYAGLYDNEAAVLPGLGAVWKRVGELAALDARFLPFLEARDGIKSQLEDLAHFLRRYADAIDVSPDRLQQVEERLALLERVKRKYGPTLADAVARRDALRRELADLDISEERLQSLTREHEEARTTYLQAANVLGRARRQIAMEFARRVEQQLGELAMERTRFEVRFAADRLSEPAWGPAGIDEAEFYVSPNPGEDLRPLARIVSGGELSRIMLAIKTLSAASRHGFTETGDRPPSGAAPGLIFDEVDAGIGGRVADVVGRKLRMLGSAFQVLCITHLPQVAAYADTHFQIEKLVDTGRTRTVVTRLDANGRVEELSRMLGGTDISAGLRASAREMLEERQATAKAKAKGESESGSPRARKGNKGRRGAEA